MGTTRTYEILTCELCGEEDSEQFMDQIDEDGEEFAHTLCIRDEEFERAMVAAEARRDAIWEGSW